MRKSVILLGILLGIPYMQAGVGRSEEKAPVFARTIPRGQDILKRLSPRHRRLILTDGDIQAIKRRIKDNAAVKRMWQQLHRHAERILTQRPSEYRIPDGKRLLATSRRVLDRVYTLALTYHLTGERRYAERAWAELRAAALFPDWNPRHFLDTAELCHAFAVGYDWLFAFLGPQRRKVLREALIAKGLRCGLASYRGEQRYGWWTRAHHNWNQVCNGGLCLGALAIADEAPQVAGEILHAGLTSIQLPSREYAPDGGWAEGPGYWNYATSYHVCLLAGLRSAVGTDFGLSQASGFERTGLFPLAMTGPTGMSFNFADAHAGTVRAPQLYWFAKTFRLPVCAYYETKRARPHVLDLIWFTEEQKSPRDARLPLGMYFRGVETATLRSSWEDPKALFVGIHAGDNRANHSHLDLGSFVLEALGVRWGIDLGADNYNLPGYFGGNRWKYYRLRAEGHNTLVIDPDEGPDQDPRGRGRIVAFEGKNEKDLFVVADLTAAYRPKARSVKRAVALREKRYVVVQDELLLARPASVWWFFHTKADVVLKEGGRSALLKAGRAQLGVFLKEPSQGRFTVKPATALPSSPRVEAQAENRGIRKLALCVKHLKKGRIVVAFVPSAGGVPAPPPEPIRPIQSW